MDLVITFFNVANGHPVFGISKGGGEIPWYVHEIPVVGISVNKPTMLADAPGDCDAAEKKQAFLRNLGG